MFIDVTMHWRQVRSMLQTRMSDDESAGVAGRVRVMQRSTSLSACTRRPKSSPELPTPRLSQLLRQRLGRKAATNPLYSDHNTVRNLAHFPHPITVDYTKPRILSCRGQ